ncbi:MAG TPA: hypothetical protein VEX65_12015 [Flavisolibacter sp.]|nr:hypothetical protein [Flavisolibacter sp.]
MKHIADNLHAADPASSPEAEKRRDLIGKEYENKLQFEEAVQQLLEEYEKHPRPPKGIFY